MNIWRKSLPVEPGGFLTLNSSVKYADLVQSYYPEMEFHHEWDVGNEDYETYYIPPTMNNFQDNDPAHLFYRA